MQIKSRQKTLYFKMPKLVTIVRIALKVGDMDEELENLQPVSVNEI